MKRELACTGCDSFRRAQAEPSTERSTRGTPGRWWGVLDAIIGAPVRLHRYRHLHAEVIEDALRAYDCGPDRGSRS
jgi:hypothetical protein